MQPVAAELDNASIKELAAYYSGLPPKRIGTDTPVSHDQIIRGQKIATLGIPSNGVPPCLSCHAGSVASFPTLAGQHGPYMLAQIRLWQKGHRSQTTHGAIMAPIAKRLTRQQAEDVVAFFESMGPAATEDEDARQGSAKASGAK
jgi:cytochrome c553